MPPLQYTLINYKELISDLTDSYFSRCVNLLYPVLGFEYLAESDVRRIDLCEKIATLPWRCSMSPRNVKIGAVQDYISALEFYMDNYLICKKGSIAEAYHAHAKQLAAELKAAPTVQGTESLFAIYLGLARELYQSGAMTEEAETIDLFVNENDANLLKNLSEFQFALRPRDIPTMGAEFYIKSSGFGTKVEIAKYPKLMLYIHNVIYYCRLMQAKEMIGEGEV